ncbi:unnamed protein product [Moneuplotes crassus]|uniref:Uncharacterized protein n=1 Tax=Euplotes crassus TaxID=5936 RepID=A0AAD1X5F1_EUPCR|nr:unnamed protein product [Moneuplotes crassus]
MEETKDDFCQSSCFSNSSFELIGESQCALTQTENYSVIETDETLEQRIESLEKENKKYSLEIKYLQKQLKNKSKKKKKGKQKGIDQPYDYDKEMHMNDPQLLTLMDEVAEKDIAILQLNTKISEIVQSNKIMIKEYEEKIKKLQKEGLGKIIERLEAKLQMSEVAMANERCCYSMEIYNLRKANEAMSEKLNEIKEKQDKHIKEQDRKKKEVNKIKKSIIKEKKELKKTEQFIRRDDEERKQEIIKNTHDVVESMYKELQDEQDALDKEKVHVNFIKNSYKITLEKKYKEEKRFLEEKVMNDRTNLRLKFQEEKQRLKAEFKQRVDTVKDELLQELQELANEELKDQIEKVTEKATMIKEEIFAGAKVKTPNTEAFLIPRVIESSLKLWEKMQEDIKNLIKCPISLVPFESPVVYKEGITMNEEQLLKIMKTNCYQCPFTRQDMTKEYYFPNKIAEDLVKLHETYSKEFDNLKDLIE